MSGLLFGGAFLMKQPGILFAVFGAVFLVYKNWRGACEAWRFSEQQRRFLSD
jgi:hypothetical protein